jgi:hypothetical protein
MKSKHGLYQGSCSVAERNPVNKNNKYVFKLNFVKVYSHIFGTYKSLFNMDKILTIIRILVADDISYTDRGCTFISTKSPSHPAVRGIETCCTKV